MPIDPICGMDVEENTPYKAEKEGCTYYFCSRRCIEEFEESRDEYICLQSEGVEE